MIRDLTIRINNYFCTSQGFSLQMTVNNNHFYSISVNNNNDFIEGYIITNNNDKLLFSFNNFINNQRAS